jgi:DUF438 domain-containing protein
MSELRTNKADVTIPEGTPFEITYDGENIDYIDYFVMGGRIFRETYTYVGGKLTEVTMPTEQ